MKIKIWPYQLKLQIVKIKEDLFIPSIQSLKGRVLEIGFGKGDHFKFYDKDTKVFGIDSKLRQTEFETKRELHLTKGNIEDLPFKDNYFDAVIGSFVLCSVKSVTLAVSEIHRVLKDGGRLILLEHIRSDNKIVLLVQKIYNLILRLMMYRCHPDRTPQVFIRKEKFHIIHEKLFDNFFEPYLFIEAVKKSA